eukprot:TRINITY_DN714_c0_g1_i2.p1 TRINITY_DN714_c0_g1~~TRINITY_DN714_c0_g1_i2.p1  ORF type:complete len:121 (+),score=15.45 TRINITY_DN714_c0_g1_i2:103-465(+)
MSGNAASDLNQDSAYKRKLQADWDMMNPLKAIEKNLALSVPEPNIDLKGDIFRSTNNIFVQKIDPYVPQLELKPKENTSQHSAFSQYFNYYRDKNLLYYPFIPSYKMAEGYVGGSGINKS